MYLEAMMLKEESKYFKRNFLNHGKNHAKYSIKLNVKLPFDRCFFI